MVDLTEAIASAMEPHLDQPFLLYGHSLGGLIAFEVSRLLGQRRVATPVHLILGAVPSPDRLPRGHLHELPSPLLVRELRRMQGTPDMILQDSEFLNLVLPALRADFEVLETYRFTAGAPLTCPITVYHGTQDGLVSEHDVVGWEAYSRRAFRLERVDAGHFFLDDPAFLGSFCRELLEIADHAAFGNRATVTK